MKPLTSHTLESVLAWREQAGTPPVATAVTVAEYLADVSRLAQRLPAGDGLLNLCSDRYHFAVLFGACLMRQKVSLQPAALTADMYARLQQEWPSCVAITDGDETVAPFPTLRLQHLLGDLKTPNSAKAAPTPADMPMIADAQTVAILYTSGSTGTPQPHIKTWARMVQSAQAEAQALGLAARRALTSPDPQAPSRTAPHPVLVGTVPVQHSYGFESTLLLALHGACSFYSGKPFFAQEVLSALASVPSPRVLVTTPYHVAHVLESGLPWPEIALCLCATAPLHATLAQKIEAQVQAPVYEIYGSTESGQLATRRTTQGPTWHLMAGLRLETQGDTTWASAGHVGARVPLGDVIELLDPPHTFLLHGRHSDMINIAGKRSSLAYLNHQLSTLPGVLDGVFYCPPEDDQNHGALTRLAAFVHAPELSNAQILAGLRLRIDAAFLPRPLVRLDSLERNATGKILQSKLHAWYLEARQQNRS